MENIEDFIIQFEKKLEGNYFCEMCSSNQKFDIKLKIVKKPKILIILILNNHKEFEISINEYIFNGSYKLICAVVNNKKTIRSLFCKSDNDKNKFKILYDSNEEMLKLEKGINNCLIKDLKNSSKPYVLYYKRTKKDSS